MELFAFALVNAHNGAQSPPMADSVEGQFVTCLHSFQDELGGVPVLLIGMLDGGIVARSCSTMNVLFVIDTSICNTKSVWAIASLGRSCFASGGEDGKLIIWQV